MFANLKTQLALLNRTILQFHNFGHKKIPPKTEKEQQKQKTALAQKRGQLKEIISKKNLTKLNMLRSIESHPIRRRVPSIIQQCYGQFLQPQKRKLEIHLFPGKNREEKTAKKKE